MISFESREFVQN